MNCDSRRNNSGLSPIILIIVVVVFSGVAALVVALENRVGADAALGMPAIGGADVAVGVGRDGSST